LPLGALAGCASPSILDAKSHRSLAPVAPDKSRFRRDKNVLSFLFKTQFNDFARQVIEVSQINARNIFEEFQTMGRQLTAHSMMMAQQGQPNWPLVQLSQFEAQISRTVASTLAEFVFFSPWCPVNKEKNMKILCATIASGHKNHSTFPRYLVLP
jgi:hypothetical protein